MNFMVVTLFGINYRKNTIENEIVFSVEKIHTTLLTIKKVEKKLLLYIKLNRV